MNCGIYCITNTINGKRYVGQSTNLRKRTNTYNNGVFHNNHLKSSVKKYGWGNFTLKVLIYCEEDQLDYYETTLIEKWDLMNRKKGYNKESGGNRDKHLSEETRKKISKSKKGQYSGFTPLTFTFENKKHIQESKEMLSKKAKLRVREKNSNYKGKMIIASEIETNKEIFFNCYTDAKEYFNSHHVNSVLKGNRKSCKGYTFRYATQQEIDNNQLYK